MTTSTLFPSGAVGSGPSSIMPTAYLYKRTGDPKVARLRSESLWRHAPRQLLRGHGGDAGLGTHIVGITSFHRSNNSQPTRGAQSFLTPPLPRADCYGLRQRMSTRIAVALAVLAAVPAAFVHFGAASVSVQIATLFYGLAIVGAAFAMSWAAEAAEHDIPRALALTAVALLAVFPEYAVDIVFAVKAGQDPTFAPYAAANMTGSNRLLLGLGWPTVSLLAWWASGQHVLRLGRDAGLPLIFLGIATLYSFTLPLRASIGLIDCVVLVGLFVIYAVVASREAHTEPELVGPAATIGALGATARRLSIVGLFAFAGVTIGAAAEPFAAGLVRTGQSLGIDEFLLVQWLAPLASEAPEFLIAALLAARGKAGAAMGLLLAAKLNQWTLLVGSLPLAYSVGAGQLAALPLDTRQG